MLLVANVYMVEQWAFPRQEGARDFKGFSVPVFTLLLFLRRVKRGVLLHLNDESDLC